MNYRLVFGLTASTLVFGCGDDGTSGTDGGGSGGTGAQGGGGANVGGGGANVGGGGANVGGGGANVGGGGSGGQGGDDCTALAEAVRTALQAAKVCDASNDGPNVCTEVREGLCCPELLNASNATALANYASALQAFETAKCQVDCPAVPCLETPSGSCVGQGANGTCTPINI